MSLAKKDGENLIGDRNCACNDFQNGYDIENSVAYGNVVGLRDWVYFIAPGFVRSGEHPQGVSARIIVESRLWFCSICLVSVAMCLTGFGPSPTVGRDLAQNTC